MAKYIVMGYKVIQYSVEVEAKSEDMAYDIGEELIRDGGGYPSDPVWQDDFEVELDWRENS
jgi:hypothetical protein